MGIFIASGCSNSKENLNEKQIDDRIVLVNIGNADRIKIANGIEKLNHCAPKIIAINAIFEDLKGASYDSALSNAINKSKNIIIPYVTTDTGFIQSNDLFTEGCLAQGIVEMWPADEAINTFKVSLYIEKKEELVWSFSFAIINYFDAGNPSYLKETKPDKDYYINFSQSSILNNGISLDSLSEISCDVLKDKIVLIGDIIYNDSEGFLTTTDSNIRVSSTIIFANIISTILSHDFKELEE